MFPQLSFFHVMSFESRGEFWWKKSGTKQYKAVIVLITCNSTKAERFCNVAVMEWKRKWLDWMSKHECRAQRKRDRIHFRACIRWQRSYHTDNSWNNGIKQINPIKCTLILLFFPCNGFPLICKGKVTRKRDHRTSLLFTKCTRDSWAPHDFVNGKSFTFLCGNVRNTF